ncbi:MAG: hypothetical protein K6C94_09220, partial [Candidatus Gastranaerophilales bacterium]|nr:hypothetical protein [Candidatus Gastranaerophilales bacterium]
TDYRKISELPENITIKKYFIYGRKENETLSECPLNTSKDKTSGLYCSAPCTKGIYEIADENTTNKLFITDGFCHVHVFDKEITDNNPEIKTLKSAGITKFIADLRFLY